MITPLDENDMLHPLAVGEKLNELIEAFNNHFHHAREFQYGTDGPLFLGEVDNAE